MLGVGSAVLWGRSRCDRDDFDIIPPIDRSRCPIFKDVSAIVHLFFIDVSVIVAQLFSHVSSIVGLFFKDVSTIVHVQVLC